MNADIRVYPDKEMKAIDMAEIVDSVQLANGIIQGCGVSIVQNALHIDDGRILINGRLGVVTAGHVELPELEATTTCYLTAVCDLAIQNPFYIALLTGADKSALDQKKSQITNFNAGNGVDYVILGTASVNPTTHEVSNWVPQNDSPVSNITAIEKLRTAINNSISSLSRSVTSLSNKIGSTAMGTTATTVTAAIKELVTKTNTTNSKLATTNSNVTAVANRATALENKTAGLVSISTSNVTANSRDYKQLKTLGMYVVLVNAATVSNSVRGMYLVGVTSGNQIGIKAISSATDVTVEDGGSGLLKITNSATLTIRLTIIRVY